MSKTIMCAQPNLDDARACLARARKHFAEFSELTDPSALWRITEGRDRLTQEWHNHLHLNREQLIAAKPVLADSATNAISALDHVAAAIARANGRTRSECRRLYFPRGRTDADFQQALNSRMEYFGNYMAEVLAGARANHHSNINHIEAARQISNCGKHRELALASGTAVAVQLVVPGGEHRIFQLPENAFAEESSQEYNRGLERLPTGPHMILIGLEVEGLDVALPTSAHSILECSFRFVQGIIDSVAIASERPPPQPSA